MAPETSSSKLYTHVNFSYVLLVISLLIVTTYVLFNMIKISINADKELVQFQGTQSSVLKRNCDSELIYSMADSQCKQICQEPGVFRTHNGVCVNVLSFDQAAVEDKCDPKKGVLAYLLGDPQFGTTKLRCLSIDPGLQPNDINKPNIVCVNGTIDINYVEGFPQLNNCECPPATFLGTVQNTSTIRQHGTCKKMELLKVYNFNNSLFTL